MEGHAPTKTRDKKGYVYKIRDIDESNNRYYLFPKNNKLGISGSDYRNSTWSAPEEHIELIKRVTTIEMPTKTKKGAKKAATKEKAKFIYGVITDEGVIDSVEDVTNADISLFASETDARESLEDSSDDSRCYLVKLRIESVQTNRLPVESKLVEVKLK